MKREKRDRGKMNVQRRAINRASIETLLPCPSVLTDVDPAFFFFFFLGKYFMETMIYGAKAFISRACVDSAVLQD